MNCYFELSFLEFRVTISCVSILCVNRNKTYLPNHHIFPRQKSLIDFIYFQLHFISASNLHELDINWTLAKTVILRAAVYRLLLREVRKFIFLGSVSMTCAHNPSLLRIFFNARCGWLASSRTCILCIVTRQLSSPAHDSLVYHHRVKDHFRLHHWEQNLKRTFHNQYFFVQRYPSRTLIMKFYCGLDVSQ